MLKGHWWCLLIKNNAHINIFRSPEKGKDDEEEVDIDLADPEVEQAALKIQAGFKGFKARQEIKELKVSQYSAKVMEACLVEIKENGMSSQAVHLVSLPFCKIFPRTSSILCVKRSFAVANLQFAKGEWMPH